MFNKLSHKDTWDSITHYATALHIQYTNTHTYSAGLRTGLDWDLEF